jgi:hypothetical protein
MQTKRAAIWTRACHGDFRPQKHSQPNFAFTLKKLSGRFHNDNFHVKAAGNIEEIKELLEAG